MKNPLICGAGEHLMSAPGIIAALDAGAGAVVVKSINESQSAREQLQRADYALFDSRWRRLSWNFSPPPDASLLCRSGLAQQSFESWLELVTNTDAAAQKKNAYVIASLIPTHSDETIDYARRIENAGIRILEVNIGAPHGEEAKDGAITLERDAERVELVTRKFCNAVSIPLWIKLTGQSANVDALADAARSGGANAVTIMGRFMGFLPDIDTFAPALSTRAAIGGYWALPLVCDWLRKTRFKMGAGFPLIATNGVRSGLDIARFMLAGASATQMTTAVFTAGLGTIPAALNELTDYLDSKKLSSADLIGLAADQVTDYHSQPIRKDYWKSFLP